MKTILLLLLISPPAFACETFHVSAAGGLHDESRDCPEACFGTNVLAKFEFGWQKDIYHAELLHIGTPFTREEGYGLTAVFGGIRYEF